MISTYSTILAFLASSCFVNAFPSATIETLPVRPNTLNKISWTKDLDNDPIWQRFTIKLGTGSNPNRTALMTVAIGLNGSEDGFWNWNTTYVTPPAPIYFLEFRALNSDGSDSPNSTYTARFTILDRNDTQVPPCHDKQPDGSKDDKGLDIPWGFGKLYDGLHHSGYDGCGSQGEWSSSPAASATSSSGAAVSTTSSSGTAASTTSSSGAAAPARKREVPSKLKTSALAQHTSFRIRRGLGLTDMD